MIGMIAAVTSNGVIGIENKIPFDYPEDMKHFKETTINSTVIMGRKTFEGIGKPLPKRRNIIVGRTPMLPIGRAATFLDTLSSAPILMEQYTSVQEALIESSKDSKDIWLIGGTSIYEEGMNYTDKIILTITPDIELRTPAIRFPWINPLLFEINSIIEVSTTKSSTSLKIVTYFNKKL